MRLLVSVADPREARAALAGGADIIDAKDPRRGALGPVPPAVLLAIRQAVGAARPLSAALGDAYDPAAVERAAGVAARHGAAFVKVGFAAVVPERRARRPAAAARPGARRRSGGRARRGLRGRADWTSLRRSRGGVTGACSRGATIPPRLRLMRRPAAPSRRPRR